MTTTALTQTQFDSSTATPQHAQPPVGAVLMMGVFTLMWMSAALNLPGGWSVLGWLGLAVGAGLVLATPVLIRHARRHPAPAAPKAVSKKLNRALGIAIAVEVVAIVIAVQLLARYNGQLNLPVIALIVALHFILIYRTFGGRLHVATTAFGTVVALAGIAAILAGAPCLTVWGLVGLGMGAITGMYGTLFATIIARQK